MYLCEGETEGDMERVNIRYWKMVKRVYVGS